MAPKDVEVQTTLIIKYLLEDEDEPRFRECSTFDPCIESDGPDDFDPVLIANKLRTIADVMNDDPKFIAALKDLKQAAAQEAVNAAFSHGVEALCEAHVSKGAEVAPEMQLIKASVAFGLYVKKSAPELKVKVQHALTSFLNQRVGTWVSQQGGWSKVPDVSK